MAPIKLVFNYFRVLGQLGLIYTMYHLASFSLSSSTILEIFQNCKKKNLKVLKFALVWLFRDRLLGIYLLQFYFVCWEFLLQRQFDEHGLANLLPTDLIEWRWPGICILVWLRIYINLNEPCYKFILRACTIYLHLNLNV